ncbi:MAG: hypothetical protein ACLQJR_34650 [Stellaceae bacterium]
MGYEITSIFPGGEQQKEFRDSAQEAVASAMGCVDRQHKDVQVKDRKTNRTYREQTLIDLHREIEGKPDA